MHALGLGTEKMEEDLKALFPEARVARADRDEISNREDMENLISRMENGEIDILIGTQMIAKGLDFPRLRFVGLALADIGFNLPDFRATERSFQLMTQMSGRAGRHGTTDENPGQVIIQTLNPDHPSLLYAPKGDFEGFAKWELEQRQQLNYPPFHRLAVVRFQGIDKAKVEEASRFVKNQLLRWTKDLKDVEILGPAEAPLARLRRQYRFHLLIKSGSVKTLTGLGQALISMQKDLKSGVRLSVDVDPLHLL
jgi:primosomal protein N' (replication factor Y)